MDHTKNGIVTREQFESRLPSDERRKKGPYVVFECFQEIPCNPCSTSCRFGAVLPMEDINRTPEVNTDNCTGCAVCVSKCPGLAAFVIDETYAPGKVLIKMPYEMLPVPEKGDIVDALDREGKAVAEGEVVSVVSGKSTDRTNVIGILVDQSLIYDVRNFRVRG